MKKPISVVCDTCDATGFVDYASAMVEQVMCTRCLGTGLINIECGCGNVHCVYAEDCPACQPEE